MIAGPVLSYKCVVSMDYHIPPLKVYPIYWLLKKTNTFVWDKDTDEALEALKLQLSRAPILAAPRPKEPMLLYINANSKTFSAAIVVEWREEGKYQPIQCPAYYISEVLYISKQTTLIGRSWS